MHVVGIGGLHREDLVVIFPVEGVAEASAVADVDRVEVLGIRDAGDLPLIGDLPDQLASLEIDDVERVVRLVGDEESLPFVVHGQVIELSRHAFETNRLRQYKRLGISSKSRSGAEEENRRKQTERELVHGNPFERTVV